MCDVNVQDMLIAGTGTLSLLYSLKSFIIDFLIKNNNEIFFLIKFMNSFHNYLLSKLTFFLLVDTSAVTLEWVMAELLQHPNIMKCAQVELDDIVGTNRLVEESDICDLPYLQAILKENFRIHPHVPFMVPHCSIEPSQVQGYYLPPNIRVMVNLWAVGRDPNTWEKPLQFDPNRFMRRRDIDVQGRHFELLPFGTGKRACPGRPLAVIFVQIVLARLLQSFDWSIPNVEEKPIDMFETYGLTLRKRKPLRVMAHPRLQAHFYH
jgi:cytochrome P450